MELFRKCFFNNNKLNGKTCLSSYIWLLQGQWISVLIAGTGIFATLLSNLDPPANFPFLMSMFNYLLLSTFFIRSFLINGNTSTPSEAQSLPQEVTSSKTLIFWYFAAAVIDVEANYLVILAYNYTSITSIMLLDCFTIPSVMILSYFILGCRYTIKHFIGISICISGLICIVINDIVNATDDDSSSNEKNPLLGDILCLSGSILYAMANVLQEKLVKLHNREEYLAHLGGFGCIIAFIQCMIVDLPTMKVTTFTYPIILYIFGFVSCLFLMYVNTSAFLTESDAILFNLSLLTSDVYAVVFTFFFQHYLVSWLYFVSFGLVIIGLSVYHSEKPAIRLSESIDSKGYHETIPYESEHHLEEDGEEEVTFNVISNQQ